MTILRLTLKKKWFDMIASGEKKEEYRDIKPYWKQRFTESGSIAFHLFRQFDIVSANNGYQKDCPNIKWKHKGIRIGEGREEWGAERCKQYFILEIGEIIEKPKPTVM